MFSSINKTFGGCSKNFGCSNKKLFVVPNFVAVTKPFISVYKVMMYAWFSSGSGIISRDELSAYYSSVVGLGAQRVGEILDEAYKALTAVS